MAGGRAGRARPGPERVRGAYRRSGTRSRTGVATCRLHRDSRSGESRAPCVGGLKEARSPPHANAPPRRLMTAPSRRRSRGPSSDEDQKAPARLRGRPTALVPSIERSGRHHRPMRGRASLGRAATHRTASGGHRRGCCPEPLSWGRCTATKSAPTFVFVSSMAQPRSLGSLGGRMRSPCLRSGSSPLALTRYTETGGSCDADTGYFLSGFSSPRCPLNSYRNFCFLQCGGSL